MHILPSIINNPPFQRFLTPWTFWETIRTNKSIRSLFPKFHTRSDCVLAFTTTETRFVEMFSFNNDVFFAWAEGGAARGAGEGHDVGGFIWFMVYDELMN